MTVDGSDFKRSIASLESVLKEFKRMTHQAPSYSSRPLFCSESDMLDALEYAHEKPEQFYRVKCFAREAYISTSGNQYCICATGMFWSNRTALMLNIDDVQYNERTKWYKFCFTDDFERVYHVFIHFCNAVLLYKPAFDDEEKSLYELF